MTTTHGYVEPGFGAVADAFATIFDAIGEDAASTSVYVAGKKVVDLWGGEDRTYDRPMGEDNVMVVASCSKGITATVLALLTQQGLINPNALVSTYWPEYGTNGKENTTVAMVASHRAGQPFLPLGTGLTGLDHQRGPKLLHALEQAAPLWDPGTAMGYHAVTYGSLLGEIIFRATGRTVGQHVRTLLRDPLGLDMWIGLPESEVDRVIPGRWEAADPFALDEQEPEPGSFAAIRRDAIKELPPFDPDFHDRAAVTEFYGTELPAIGAITNARSLARMYAALIGTVDGTQLLTPQTLSEVTTPQTDGIPALIEAGTTGPDIRFGLGYQLTSGSLPGFGPHTFGHTGAGGRLGIADTDLGVSFGYVCSRMRNIGDTGDPRWQTLINAVKTSL